MYGNKVRNKDYTLLLSSPPPNFYPFSSHSLPPTPTPLPLSSSSFFFYSMLTFQPVSNLLAYDTFKRDRNVRKQGQKQSLYSNIITSTTEFPPPPFPPIPPTPPTPTPLSSHFYPFFLILVPL